MTTTSVAAITDRRETAATVQGADPVLTARLAATLAAADPAQFHQQIDALGNCGWCMRPATPGTLCPALLDGADDSSLIIGSADYDQPRNTIGGAR